MDITTKILLKDFEKNKQAFAAEKSAPCAVCGRKARFVDPEAGMLYVHKKCLPHLWEQYIANAIKA